MLDQIRVTDIALAVQAALLLPLLLSALIYLAGLVRKSDKIMRTAIVIQVWAMGLSSLLWIYVVLLTHNQ